MYNRVTFEEKVSTIFTVMIANWATCINLHPSIHQVATQRMTIMSKSLKEVLYLVRALQLPDFFPRTLLIPVATSLVAIIVCTPYSILPSYFISTLHTESTMLIKVSGKNILSPLMDGKSKD
jgi:hypothetical protein